MNKTAVCAHAGLVLLLLDTSRTKKKTHTHDEGLDAVVEVTIMKSLLSVCLLRSRWQHIHTLDIDERYSV